MMAHFDSFETGDTCYPALLTLIADPPRRLWYRGDLSVLSRPRVAIVGSRKSTDYGRWAAHTIAKRLSSSGVCVVSGMADGIDAAAHRGALAGGSPTIAVFGCGLDICFPKSNRELMKEIARRGLLLSEYEPGTRPAKYTFPRRNRIISGLSVATVVAEAGVSSGSLITAECALEQGREVYAVPGDINRIGSIGCNKLIADGARPLVFIDDILTDLGFLAPPAGNWPESLSGEEQRALAAVRQQGEIAYDRLARALGVSVGAAVSVATVLELKGVVHIAAGKVFCSAVPQR